MSDDDDLGARRVEHDERALRRAQGLLEEATAALDQRDQEIHHCVAVLEAILAVSPPLAVLKGGRIEAWSRSLEEITGLRADVAVGRRLPQALAGPRLITAHADGRTWEVRMTRDDQTGVEVVVLVPETGVPPFRRAGHG